MSKFIDSEAQCEDIVSADEKSEAPNSEDEKFIDDGQDDEVIVPETPTLYRQVDNDRERAFSPPVRPALPPDHIEDAQTPLSVLATLATPIPLVNQYEPVREDTSHIPNIDLTPVHTQAREVNNSDIIISRQISNDEAPLSILSSVNQFIDSKEAPHEDKLSDDDLQKDGQGKIFTATIWQGLNSLNQYIHSISEEHFHYVSVVFEETSDHHHHAHVYLELNKQMRNNAVKKLFDSDVVRNCHVERVKSNNRCKKYCSTSKYVDDDLGKAFENKHNQKVITGFEIGTYVKKSNNRKQKKDDLDEFTKACKEVLANPSYSVGQIAYRAMQQGNFSVVKYSAKLACINQINMEVGNPQWTQKACLFMYGDTGLGKSSTAISLIKTKAKAAKWIPFIEGTDPFFVIQKPNINQGAVWYDGLSDHYGIIINDWDGKWISMDTMLDICDGYKQKVPIKGGFVPAKWKVVVITSNLSIEQIFDSLDYTHREQLKIQHKLGLIRRIVGPFKIKGKIFNYPERIQHFIPINPFPIHNTIDGLDVVVDTIYHDIEYNTAI